MGEAQRDVWVCDVCGHEWIKGDKYPERCTSQRCRTMVWDRKRKSNVGRPDKSQVKQSKRQVCDGTALCACLLCLSSISTQSNVNPRKGITWKPGVTSKAMRQKLRESEGVSLTGNNGRKGMTTGDSGVVGQTARIPATLTDFGEDFG